MLTLGLCHGPNSTVMATLRGLDGCIRHVAKSNTRGPSEKSLPGRIRFPDDLRSYNAKPRLSMRGGSLNSVGLQQTSQIDYCVRASESVMKERRDKHHPDPLEEVARYQCSAVHGGTVSYQDKPR